MEKSLLEKLNEYANSDIEKYDKEFFDKVDQNELKIQKYHNELQGLTDEQFEVLLHKEFQLHGEDWSNKCYEENVEPYPQETLQNIIDVMQSFCENSKDDEFYVYKGFTIQNIYGQGMFTNFYKNNQLIFSI